MFGTYSFFFESFDRSEPAISCYECLFYEQFGSMMGGGGGGGGIHDVHHVLGKTGES